MGDDVDHLSHDCVDLLLLLGKTAAYLDREGERIEDRVDFSSTYSAGDDWSR